MCGIAGVLAEQSSDTLRQQVGRMLARLVHRGPDDVGVWSDAGVCLGHRRLSIIDLSSAGHQPMVDDAQHYAVTFNGEIYNFGELRTELEHQGIRFHSRTDTEVLLKGYVAWGPKVIERIKGFYAFAMWDGRRRRLVCARDPFGKKPLYYYADGRRFVFASEVEAVIAGLERRPPIHEAVLAHYLWKGYSPPGESIYRSVQTVPAGSLLEIDAVTGSICTTTSVQPTFHLAAGTPVAYGAILEQCRHAVRTAVGRRLQSDVPLGVLLSGGVDSSLVSLMAAEATTEPVHTFAAAFDAADFDETRYAARVAARAGTRHTEVPVAMEDIPALLPRLVRTYGEPFGDDSAIPTYALFAAIKPFVTVILTGDGGDEVFGGYKDVRLFRLRQCLRPLLGLGQVVPRGIADRLVEARSARCRAIGYAALALRCQGADAFGALMRGGWTHRWRKRLLRPEIWRATGEADVERTTARKFGALGRSDIERYLNLTLERLTQGYLVKVDRASMAHSLEARSPLLDTDLFAMVSRLSPQALLRHRQPKSLLKDLLDERMDAGFARRPKRGFTPPLIQWFKKPETATWLERRLTATTSFAHTLLQPGAVSYLLRRHAAGYDETGRLWKLLFLNEWHAQVVAGARIDETTPH